MEQLKLIFIITIFSMPVLVLAESNEPDKSVDKWTCEEFTAIDEQFKPKAVYWAIAQSKTGKKSKDKVLDIEGTEQVIPIVIDECIQEPKASFWQKLKTSWKNTEKAAKDKLKDIKSEMGDIKTNLMNKTTK